MLELEKKIFMFNIKEIHLADRPYDINGYSFIKFYDCKKKLNVKGFNCKEELTLIIDLTQDLDKIYQNMNKNTRYSIRKGQKMGISVKKEDNFNHFFQLYESFKVKKGLKSIFEVVGVGKISYEDMKKHGTLFIAYYSNEILAGGIYLENSSIIKGLLGASIRFNIDKNKKNIVGYANRLIEWEAMKYAKMKNIKEFDFGGLWSEQEAEKDQQKKGINSFKLGFGGEIVSHYSYYKIYSKIYSLLYNLYTLKNFTGR